MATDDYSDVIAAAANHKKDDYSDLIAAAKSKPLTEAQKQALTHRPGEGASQAAVGTHEGEMSAGDERLKQFNDRVSGVGRGASELYSAARHPIDTANNPAKSRQLVRGASDVFLGYPVKIADAIHNAQGHGRPLASVETADTVAEPDARMAGSMAAMALPNPWGIAGKAGGALAEKAFSALPVGGTGTGAGLGLLKNLFAYEAVAPAMAAAHADNSGRRMEAAKEAATDPMNLALSGILGTATGASRGKAVAIRDPKTMSGRVLQDVKAAGGEIKPFGEPVRGGLYETPEMSSLPEGRTGVNELASRTESALKEHGREKLSDARANYHDQSQAILSEHQEPVPSESTRTVLDDMEKRAMLSTGKVADKKLHGFVQEMRDLLSTETDQPDMAHLRGTGNLRMLQRQAVPVADLVKLKQLSNDAAEWGQPATRENSPYRLIYHALGEDAAAVDPRIKALNQQYGQTMRELEEANDILYGRRKPDVADSSAKSKSATLKLGRVGDDTQAGTTDAEQLKRLRNIDPKYAESLRMLEAKKAAERLRYGEPEVSTGMEKGQAHAAKKTAHRVVGGAAGAMFGHGAVGHAIGTAVGYGAGAALDNPLALQLRLGLPIAEALGGKTGLPTALKLRMLADEADRERSLDKRAQEAR